MVKLPRAEQRSIYTPADMPHLAGDGWTAPARAMQGLGKAITGFGEALKDAEDHVDPRQLQEAKLAQLQFVNDWNQEELQSQSTYAGDGKDYGTSRTDLFNQRSQEFLSRWPDPVRRRLELSQESFRGQVQRDTFSFGYNRYNDTLYSNTGRAITGEMGRFASYVENEERLNLYRENPAQFSADLEAHVQSMDAIIDGLPLAESRKDQLRNDAAQQLQDTLSRLPAGVTLGTARQQIERFSVPRAGGEGAGEPAGPQPRTEAPAPASGQGPDFRGRQGPASIRYNNPGAMYPGPSSRKFGAVETKIIGGGHKIAVFPDAVSGAAAQFDLLSRSYAGKSLRSAISKWSGGNSVATYLNVIQRDTGLSPDTVLTREMVRDPRIAIPIAKAMAVQEAGRSYPLDDAQWVQAHAMAFGGSTQTAQNDNQPVRVAALGSTATDAAATDATPSIRTSSGDVRMADSGQPTGTFRGSVANHLAERLIKQLPALENKHKAEVAAKVKTVADRASRGEIIPPNEETAIRAELARLNDDEISTAFEMALAAAQTTAQFKQLPPAALETLMLQMRAKATAEGTSAAMSAQLAAMEKLHDTMVKELKDNPLGWAVESGVIPGLPPLSPDPQSFAERALAARAVADHYGSAYFRAFTPDERTLLAEQLNQGGPEAALVLTAMTQAFGQDAPRAMAEFTKDAPEAALLGWIIHAGGDSATIKDATDALALRRSEGFKSIAPGPVVARKAAIDVVGSAFQHMPKNEQYATDLANLLYEVRARRAGTAEFDAELWKKGFNEALGANTDPATGTTYGGIAYNFPNLLFPGGSDPFIAPANVDAARARELLDAIRITDLVEGGMPVPGMIDRMAPPPKTREGEAAPTQDDAGAEDKRARRGEIDERLRQIEANTDPAMRDAPNPERDRLLLERSIIGAASEPQQAEGDQTDTSATAAALGVQGFANIPALTALQQKGLPVDEKGRPVSMDTIRRARLVTVGDGQYFLAMGGGEDPRYIRTPTGENYVLDLKALEPVLSDRRPDLYRWR